MQRCDVFCKIVDNFGDIGVCWRLSQQLANEHGLAVRLLIDDYSVASQIIPSLSPDNSTQVISHVTIAPWTDTLATPLPNLVIENFSCGLPAEYAQLVAQQQQSADTPITWINLEYLSAEAWIEGFHLMPSQHPQLGFTKTFYYPGFSASTGGLLRERDLIRRRQAWQITSAQMAFWQSLGFAQEAMQASIKLSLFCYPQANSVGLIQDLQTSRTPICVFVPANADSELLQTLTRHFPLDAHGKYQQGHFTLQVLPFLSQAQYDQLLASCDLNFVRGEDSWIRAIWSGKPFIWQPYIQSEDTHLVKLKAFLQQYLQQTISDGAVTTLIEQAHLQWSNALAPNQMTHWANVIEQRKAWHAASERACLHYQTQPSLTEQLMDFWQKTV